jgi:SulP family sulfate permease
VQIGGPTGAFVVIVYGIVQKYGVDGLMVATLMGGLILVGSGLARRGEVYEINGPFFFGAAEKFKDTLLEVSRKPKVLIIRMRNVPAIDSTGMHALKDLVRSTKRDGTAIFLSDVHSQPLIALGRSELLDEIGEERTFGSIDEALAAAAALTVPG